jgi:hypothetical protein
MSEKQVENVEQMDVGFRQLMADLRERRYIVYPARGRKGVIWHVIAPPISFADFSITSEKTIRDDEYLEDDKSGAALAQEEELKQLQAQCFQLSEYIHDNIVDILKIREENDRLSEELRGAMAKLKAA